MIDYLIQFSLKRKLLVMFLALSILITGILSWKKLPIDAFPDVTNVQVTIITTAPGLIPVEVERLITFPIEIEMNGLPKVQRIRSLSRPGLSHVIVMFEDGTDDYFARQIVAEQLQEVAEKLPEGIRPSLAPLSTGLGEVLMYEVKSDRHNLMELRTIHDWQIVPQLKAVNGVTEVNSFGGHVKQYHILVDPNELTRYDISLNDIFESLEKNNINTQGNYVNKAGEAFYVRGVGLIENLEDFNSIVVSTSENTPIYLRDVAQVKEKPAPRLGLATAHGEGETLEGLVVMLKGSNSKIVTEEVKKKLEHVKESLPEGVVIELFYDRTELIQACIKTIISALAIGAISVIIALFLVMGNLRISFIVALSLPLSVLVAFILMKVTKLDANLMTLGGMAIAIGMIVDASIIMAENIARYLGEAKDKSVSKLQVCIKAAQEVGTPIVSAVCIIMVVMMPLFALQEMEGKMFKPLVWTMIFTLFGSLVASLIIVPVFCAVILKQEKETKTPVFFRVLQSIYGHVLKLTIKFKYVVLVTSVLAFGYSIYLVPKLGTEFVPKLDEGSIVINLIRYPTISLEESARTCGLVEKALKEIPEVTVVVSETGTPSLAEDPMGFELSDVYVGLKPKDEWVTAKSKTELIKVISNKLSEIRGINYGFSQPIDMKINEMTSGSRADVAIKLFGDSLEVLIAKANEIAPFIEKIPGAADVSVELISGFAQLEVKPRRKDIARYGINVEDVNDLVEMAVGGKVSGEVFEGQKRFDIVVRLPEKYRYNEEVIGDILVPTFDGKRVPIHEIADISFSSGPNRVNKENGIRLLRVNVNVRDRDLGGFVNEAQEVISNNVEIPPGYYVQWGGQFEHQERAMKQLSFLVPIAIFVIFILLISTFQSIKGSLLVISELPFAVMGGIFTLYYFDINLSVSASVGFIALFGLGAQDHITIISYLNKLKADGKSCVEAINEGMRVKLRPVVMTSLTTLLGLLPLIWSSGIGAEVQRPIAIVVFGGMGMALFVTLVLLPVFYLVFEKD